jgi:hypothetical protein
VREVLEVIKARIDEGSELSIGPSGLSLGGAPKLTESTQEQEKQLLSKIDDKTGISDSGDKADTIQSLVDSVYLVHGAEYFKTAGPSYDRRQVYSVRVQVGADSDSLLDRIEKVVYTKHSSFKRRFEETHDRASSFELIERLWGQFNLKAEVYFRHHDQPLVLYRYLNF